jgi:hypothetical protein
MILFPILFSCTVQSSAHEPPPAKPEPQKQTVQKETPPAKLMEVIGSTTFNDLETCQRQIAKCHCPQRDNCFAFYESNVEPIPTDILDKIGRSTWREGCPVPLTDLSLVTIHHWDVNGTVAKGQLIVSKNEADNIASIFQELYNVEFPIVSMKPMYHFNGSDDASMNANNTSAFNCRNIKNTTRYSQHSYGEAIDVNPLWNPWVKGNIVDPPAGKAYLNRSLALPGLIKDGDVAVTTFEKHGWKWGGHWTTRKDYQHFSTSGK